MSNQWLTPDGAPTGVRHLVLTLPSGDEWEALARGGLALLLLAENFEPFGSYSPEDTAQEFAATLSVTFEDWIEDV